MVLLETWSWRKRLATFVAALGGGWLLLEPLLALTGAMSILSRYGWPAWAMLIVVSFGASVVAEWIFLRRQLGNVAVVTFVLEFVRSGRRLEIVAARDMQVEVFLERFIGELRKIFPEDCAAMHIYKHNLLLKRCNGKFKSIRSSMTFREAGVEDGSICRLRGYIRAEYTRPLLTIGYGRELAELEKRRKEEDYVLMDERDSIGYEAAKEMGVLSSEAIAGVERFPYRDSATFFVVLCPESDIDETPDPARGGLK